LIDYNLEWIPPFFVEEYFPQGTLAEHMMEYFRAGYVFDEAQALGFITQILESLAEVHGRNIIHRDIKPSNIMMANGQLVITDMGLGRTLNRATRLQTRAFMGTKFYAAPEQEMGTGGVDHRSDLYAVGVILHELLTGERGAYNRQIYGGDPAIRTIIKQLLMFDKRQRYASAKQVLGLVRQSMMAPQQPFWM
jgi:serine/threonine protein kinase